MCPTCGVQFFRHCWAKLAWLAGLGLWMALCYFPAQVWNPRAPWVVPYLPLEPRPVYHPIWVLMYQSVWLAHAAMIWAPGCLEPARRYARDTAISYALAAPVFWILPTTVNRPSEGDSLYRSLVLALDGPTNALPSLHAVMAALVVLHLRPAVGRPVYVMLGVWWVFLLAATLATGQHRMLDLLAGTALAAGVHFAGGGSRSGRCGRWTGAIRNRP
jgi:hypothetical protein